VRSGERPRENDLGLHLPSLIQIHRPNEQGQRQCQ
jgi:hypothetical protein